MEFEKKFNPNMDSIKVRLEIRFEKSNSCTKKNFIIDSCKTLTDLRKKIQERLPEFEQYEHCFPLHFFELEFNWIG